MTTTPSLPARRRPFSWRAFVSLLVAITFIVLAVTGIGLYATPPGRIANWSNWTLAGLTKANWQAVHMVFGLLFVVAGAFHVFFNWRVLLHYLRSRVQAGIPRWRELALATATGLALVIASIAELPPVSAVADLREQLANSWSTSSAEPPIPHAELLTVEKAAALVSIPVQTALNRLSAAGYRVEPSATLESLASQRGVTPRDVYTALAASAAPTPKTLAAAGGPGMGWKTLRQIAEETGMPVEAAVARLRAGGLDASPDEPLRDIAKRHGRHAPEIAALLARDQEGAVTR